MSVTDGVHDQGSVSIQTAQGLCLNTSVDTGQHTVVRSDRLLGKVRASRRKLAVEWKQLKGFASNLCSGGVVRLDDLVERCVGDGSEVTHLLDGSVAENSKPFISNDKPQLIEVVDRLDCDRRILVQLEVRILTSETDEGNEGQCHERHRQHHDEFGSNIHGSFLSPRLEAVENFCSFCFVFGRGDQAIVK